MVKRDNFTPLAKRKVGILTQRDGFKCFWTICADYVELMIDDKHCKVSACGKVEWKNRDDVDY